MLAAGMSLMSRQPCPCHLTASSQLTEWHHESAVYVSVYIGKTQVLYIKDGHKRSSAIKWFAHPDF